jgi:hypothetical protein
VGGFVVEKVAEGQVFSKYSYSFTVHVSIIQTLIDQHMHYALKLHTKTQSLH